MKRLFKKLAAVGTALTMILPMAACGGGSGATHSDTLKKTINVAFDAQPNTYDPHASGATAVAQVATWIFEKLFEGEFGGGYPKERVEPEQANKKILDKVKQITHKDMLTILKEIDKEFLYQTINREQFKKYFFENAEDGAIKDYIKTII